MHIILLCADGHSPSQIARVLYCSRTTVYTTARRFLQAGEAAFADQRPRGPVPTLDQLAQQRLERLVERERPLQHGFLRSRWTCPLLAWQLLRERGLAVSHETIRRALHRLGFRWRRPRPVPPSKNPEEKRQRLLQILTVLGQLARAEGFFFQDETRLELNPKVGFAWMRRGDQQHLPTPGTNRKVWLSGALNWLTGRLHWVVGLRKDSELFLRLLEELRWTYRCHRQLHLALDNDGSHRSKLVRACLASSGGRLCLHPLPAWSPEANPMESIWWGLHEAITRNHRCLDLRELLGYAECYLAQRQPFRPTLGQVYQELERSPP
jgi:transposase